MLLNGIVKQALTDIQLLLIAIHVYELRGCNKK